MQWNELFGKEDEPSKAQVKEFIDNPIWSSLDDFLKEVYNVKAKLAYSGCAMDKGIWMGWNIKYKKGGKALCTIYPKSGYFLLLMPIGLNEMTDAELLMPLCTTYTQDLFKHTTLGHNGKSLAFEVKNEDVLEDIKKLIGIRLN